MEESAGTMAEGQAVRYLDTASCYDLWSKVYDTDGNFLQALDTIEMQTLLPTLLSLVSGPKPWRIVDLGCGTGRNTAALLRNEEIEVTALDLSPKMLEIAKHRLVEKSSTNSEPKLNLGVFDMMSGAALPVTARDADAIVSTLVVEHIPLDNFFTTAAEMLKPGGVLLVTNMHAEMGQVSQAGFVDPESGDKIRPKSYAHTVDQVVAAARLHGFESIGRIKETAVDQELCSRLGVRAQKWIGTTVWFGGILKKSLQS